MTIDENAAYPPCGRGQFFCLVRRNSVAALRGRAVVVAGGRRQDGIVLSASRRAKAFGVKSGMACFRARQLCAELVVCPARPEVYRQISARMFAVLNRFSPLVVPVSIDEGFLDLSAEADGAARWHELSAAVSREVGLALSGGLANSRWASKLATDAGKPGFLEIAAGTEKEFLSPRDLRELSGIGDHRAERIGRVGRADVRRRGRAALDAVAASGLEFGGKNLWLFANGEWTEKLLAEARTRTMISRQKTFSFDVRLIMAACCSSAWSS